MGFFDIFKKNKTEVKEKMSTLEQVRKAYEDLSEDDKKSFHQSIADRVHESIAAQEVDEDDKDTQTAEDREHEALGEEHAEGKGDVEELHETDEGEEGAKEEFKQHDKEEGVKFAELEAKLDALSQRLEELFKGKTDEEKLNESKQRYGFKPTAGKIDEGEKITPEEALARIRNI